MPAVLLRNDVDRIISNEEPPISLTHNLNSHELFFWEHSIQHRRLLHIKHLFRTHPAVDAQFNERSNKYSQSSYTETMLLVYLRSYERAFVEVNRANAGCFDGGRVRKFLDLGCSPGGTSYWLLKANRDAIGLGLTLPDEEAKFPMSGKPAAIGRKRYLVRYENIITLAMGAVAEGLNPVVKLDEDLGYGVVFADLNDHPYDLVIAGAFPTLEGQIPWWLRVQLLLSQVLIIMSNVAPDGACVVVINTKPFMWVVDLIGMLRASFLSVAACKSGRFHAKRSSCYIVCRGFRATEQDVRDYTSRIRAALQHLDHVAYESRLDGGEADTKLGVPGVVPQGLRTASGYEDLPLLSGQSASSIFQAQSRFVLDLFEPMWDAQFAAIRTEFAGILSPQTGGK
ncbi:hypothetical protein B0H21DRAFT_152602 [Amylocystis lapponica]|nr:hypothetical protein B0H21DRAFT_152602 [Amylocystis lapponica]